MTTRLLLVLAVALAALAGAFLRTDHPANAADAANDKYADDVKPLVKKYCLSCHSTKLKKGSLDLERFASLDDVKKDVKPWQQTIEMLETGEMPPKDKPQPTADERKKLLAWIVQFLEGEAKTRAGDPGYVPLRRLSNAEYDHTIRQLTGVDLRPTQTFPADGAGGEGFTNAAESLTEISPALLTKYLAAAKDVADHAVLLPDGIRFSPTKTRRDWTDESVARLRAFYADFAPGDGRLLIQPYLAATVRHREALSAKKTTIVDVAAKEKLNAKYLGVLWKTMTDNAPSSPLDEIRARWGAATEKDVTALAADVAAWQATLWKTVKVGSYVYLDGSTYRESHARQLANDPAASETQTIRLPVKPPAGSADVVLYLAAHEIGAGKGGVTWSRPRFEKGGKDPLLLKDYATFGGAYEVDFPTAFADAAKYLGAAAEAAHDRKQTRAALAKKHGLNEAFLSRWMDVLAVAPAGQGDDNGGKVVPAVALELLTEKNPKNEKQPSISGWRKKGTDLPVLVTNASDKTLNIPGTVPAHKVAVHPTPTEFVAVTWKSPVAGSVSVAAAIKHAHPACGNGVAWWLEHRRGGRAVVHAEGVVDLGKAAKAPAKTLKVEKGDVVMLAIDARAGNHVCDLTQIDLTIAQNDKPNNTWDLAADVADDVMKGNPHADKHGNKETWSFVKGPTRAVGKAAKVVIPPGSILDTWRELAADPERLRHAAKLAGQVQTMLTGPKPVRGKEVDRALYDNLVSIDSELFRGVDLSTIGKPKTSSAKYGLPKERFDKDGNVAASETVEVRLPAALFREREFVVEGKLSAAGGRVVRFVAQTSPPAKEGRWDGKSPVVASSDGPAYKKLISGHDEFRRCFPLFLCFPTVVPTDEVVTLKMFHREDEPLERLFLDDAQKKRIDHLWTEHRFISQQPAVENKYLPQFIGFVTQDQPKTMVTFFENQRPAFKARAEAFEKDSAAAIPKQTDALLAFAERAFRRPLSDKQKADLLALYKALLSKGVSHEEALRGVLAKVFVSPAFLFRIEKAPEGLKPGHVDDWELASRLSYFLTSAGPDDELRTLAAAGKLRDEKTLAAQARRLLKSDGVRALAVEFGTQWIHVRGFDEFKEKNEKLFPTFDVSMRKAIYEESILFFTDLFQADRPVSHVLDADATFLNEALAKHYGIPGVSGPQWRRVTGVKKFGRGGILGLASVQAKQAGASRTSPVLRGNWVVETLLGEKLPRPPADVPQLPEEEGKDKLSMRQLVERHAKDKACAVCHVRIDPYGFAFEKYDPIGRRRDKEIGGQPIDTKAKLKDGTEFDGIDGLRTYLLTKKKDVIVRLFCRKLLGYSLGRAASLSDSALIDEMAAALNAKDATLSAAVAKIVTSPQFRMIRGSGVGE